MTPDIRKERETALYEAALRLIAKGVNPAAMKVCLLYTSPSPRD